MTAVWPAWRRRRKSERIWWFISVLRLDNADRLDHEVRDEIRNDRDPWFESVLDLDGNVADLVGRGPRPAAARAHTGGVRRLSGADRGPDVDVSLSRRRCGRTVRATAVGVRVPGHRVGIGAQVDPLADSFHRPEDLAIGGLL